MNRWQYAVLLTLGVVCLGLSLMTIVFAWENRKLQESVQAQQVIINKGNLSQQIGTNLLREMAQVAQTNEKMKALLQENGFSISDEPTASPAP